MPGGPETWGNLETWGQMGSSPRSQVGWPRVSTQTLRAHKRLVADYSPETPFTQVIRSTVLNERDIAIVFSDLLILKC